MHLMRFLSCAVLIVSVLFAVGAPYIADAHGAGASLEAPSAPYLIDIGIEPEIFESGVPVRFDFALLDLDTGDVAEFDHVWVRVTDENTTYLATGVHMQEVGPTTLLYSFEIPGTYVLDVSFRESDGTQLANANFPLNVVSSGDRDNERNPMVRIAGAVLLLILGILLGLFYSKTRRTH